MGRKKIAIARITDERNRQITFCKRKAGLLKKAYELSILCDCEIAVIMISSNRKLYQYASSNMNSILIRYTEFKDPDESKTNADILDDIQRKERMIQPGDGSGEEGEHSGSLRSAPFLLTPHIQAQYGKMNEDFDTMLQRNQIQLIPEHLTPAPGGSGGGGGEMGVVRERGPPRVMPVTVPVAQSPGAINTHITQHLVQQMDARAAGVASSLAAVGAGNSGSSASSSGTISSLVSPQSDMSASPSSAKSLKSPAAMPPPLGTPTRLQTLRNQSLKLHLPGSGRNYISLGSGGTISPGGRKGREGGEGEEGAGPGTKPHLRVKIPGQKGFVPRTQVTSPLPQMELTTAAISGAKDLSTTASTITMTAHQRSEKDGSGQTAAGLAASTTHTESLTTPILSLATPNLLSAFPPPLFSSLTGDFPFSALMSGGLGSSSGTGGGGGGGELSSALVAFPVSIQPSSSSGGGSSAGNIVLQAQNMGQPFLLTPNVDPRQNPLLSQTTFTPPPLSSSSSLSPNVRDLEQLKHQYERVQQQLLQQQLFISQQLHHQQQQMLGGKEGGGGGAARKSTPTPPSKEGSTQHKETATGSQHKETSAIVGGGERPKIHLQTVSPSLRDGQEDMDTGENVGTPPKRPRVESSPDEQPTSV